MKERRGNVAIIYALAAAPLLLLMGASVDYSMLVRARAAAQSAADAGVLAALAPATPDNAREEAATSAFLANLPPSLNGMNPRLQTTVSERDGVRTATATFTLDHPLYFMRAVAGETSEVGGVAEASISLQDHVDIDFWLDGSASMGVAADEAGRDALRALSRHDPELQNCAFACHIPTRLNGPYRNTQERAHANGIALRMDVMIQNVGGLIDAMQAEVGPERQIRYSLNRLAVGFEELLPLTEDVEEVRREVRDFHLAGTHHGASASMIERTIEDGADALPDRRRPGAPRRVVVLVTDGMQFNWGSVRSGEIDPAVCQHVKETGAIMAVVHLRYVELNGDWAFEHYVRPHFDELGPALQACASSGYYFRGDSPEEIQTAFGELAMRLRESLRLTH